MKMLAPRAGPRSSGDVEAGRADHDVDAGGDGLAGVGHRGVGDREVDEHVGRSRARRATRRAERRIGAADELHVVGALDRPAHGLPHPPRRAGDGDPDRRTQRHRAALPSAGRAAAPRSKRSSSGPMPAADSRSGAHSSSASAGQVLERHRVDPLARPRRARAAASPARISEPSRFIRAPVDSSASTTRPLRFSLARSSSSAVAGSSRRRASSVPTTASASARLSARVPTYRPT